MNKFILRFGLICLLALVFAGQVSAQIYSPGQDYEHILNYAVIVNVQKDSSLIVDETITVFVTNEKINHGIYRDFPTQYKSILGLSDATTFLPQIVEIDGRSEKYHTKKLKNGIRLYIGDEAHYVTTGLHTYHIRYQTQNQLRFANQKTEIYYNLVGTGWEFDIEQIEASIVLPANYTANQLEINGYSGAQDQKGQNFTYQVTNNNGQTTIGFKSKQRYLAGEGLTASVIFPASAAISQPALTTKLLLFTAANLGFILVTGLTLASLAIALLLWLIKGRDPQKGVIIPLFSPPEDLTPADIRYLYKMGFDNKALTATITDMAVKGYLQIIEKDGQYSLKKKKYKTEQLNEQEKLVVKLFQGKNDDENEILEILLGDKKIVEHIESDLLKQINSQTKKEVTFKFSNKSYRKISKLIGDLKKQLKAKFENTHFFSNGKYAVISIVMLIFSLLVYILFYGILAGSDQSAVSIFMLFWLSIWSIGVIAMLPLFANMCRAIFKLVTFRSGDIKTLGKDIFGGLFTLPFIAGELIGLVIFIQFAPLLVAVDFILQAILIVAFYKAIKARTTLGRQVMDKIQGFKMFLDTTEQKRLAMMHQSLPLTLEVYEKYLPYAIALDAEVPWTNSFKSQIEKALTMDPEHQLIWYSSGRPFTSTAFASSMSSFGSGMSTSIASSSISPSSGRGGGGGGGSSGGGGGGGGGGGW